MADTTALDVAHEGAVTRIVPVGDWTVLTLSRIVKDAEKLCARAQSGPTIIDVSRLGRLDTSGALMLARCAARGGVTAPRIEGEHDYAAGLIEQVSEAWEPAPKTRRRETGLIPLLERTGKGLEAAVIDAYENLAFFGRTLAALGKLFVAPHKFRWTATVNVMEQAGLNALPIIAMLNFFIGAVVAYIGLNQLANFGASIFAVELVAIAVLREFGVLITAIMLAGRSDSAFTAQIGSMKMQQEIDAMQVMGLDPYDVLVAPRLVAVVLMAPLMTFVSMIAGMIGGMVVIWSVLGYTPGFFIARMYETVTITHFWAGMAKAPVFATVIAVVGCRQGMKVGGDVESLGRRVTASVVQSIFLVILIDALFAMAYLELGI